MVSWLLPLPNPTMAVDMAMVDMAMVTVMVDTVMAVDMVDTVDTTVERDLLMPSPKPKPPLLPNPKLKPKLIPTTMVDTVMVDTVMAVTTVAPMDTDTTITARDLLNPNPAMDTVTTVELLLRIKSLENFCLNNLAPYPF